MEEVKKLIIDSVSRICKKELVFLYNIKIQGLIGITIDDDKVILVQVEEIQSAVNDRFTQLISPKRYPAGRNNNSVSRVSASPGYQESALKLKGPVSSRSQYASRDRCTRPLSVGAEENLAKISLFSPSRPSAATVTQSIKRSKTSSSSLESSNYDVMIVDSEDSDNEQRAIPKVVGAGNESVYEGNVKQEASDFMNPSGMKERPYDPDVKIEVVQKLSSSLCGPIDINDNSLMDDVDIFKNITPRSASRRVKLEYSNVDTIIAQGQGSTAGETGSFEPADVEILQDTFRKIAQQSDLRDQYYTNEPGEILTFDHYANNSPGFNYQPSNRYYDQFKLKYEDEEDEEEEEYDEEEEQEDEAVEETIEKHFDPDYIPPEDLSSSNLSLTSKQSVRRVNKDVRNPSSIQLTCQYEGCGCSYAGRCAKANLVRHQREVHGRAYGADYEAFFVCHVGNCKKIFRRSMTLQKHMDTVHN